MREAHPIDGKMPAPFGLVEDPIDDKERANVAKTCVKDLELRMPALVDRVDDKVQTAYGGWPDRLYLVDKDGRIAFAGERGPHGFDPDPWAKAIEAEKARIAAEKPAPPAGDKPPEKRAGGGEHPVESAKDEFTSDPELFRLLAPTHPERNAAVVPDR